MVFWLAILVGGLFAWIAVQIGFYGAWILFFNLLLSAYMAVFIAPVVVANIPAATAIPGYGYALTLMSIAIATLFIAYGISYACLSGQLRVGFPKVCDNVGAGVLGFLSGFLVCSFLGFAFSLTPLAQLDLCKTLQLDAPSQTANTDYVCFWCNRLHSFVAASRSNVTAQRAVEQLRELANANPPPAGTSQPGDSGTTIKAPTRMDAAAADGNQPDAGGTDVPKPEGGQPPVNTGAGPDGSEPPSPNRSTGGTPAPQSDAPASSIGDSGRPTLANPSGDGNAPAAPPANAPVTNDNPFATDANSTPPAKKPAGESQPPLLPKGRSTSENQPAATPDQNPFAGRTPPAKKPAEESQPPLLPKGKSSSDDKPTTMPKQNPLAGDETTTTPAGLQGPLAGTWQSTMGAQFRIDDDGKAIKIKVLSSDMLIGLSGQLVRSDDKPDALSGTLELVSRIDAPKRHRISATATIDGDELRLSCTNWPIWNKQGKCIGHRPTPMVETFTRSEDRPTIPGRPENPLAAPRRFENQSTK
jgi:hypothetical protein